MSRETPGWRGGGGGFGGDAHFAALIDPLPSSSPSTASIRWVPQLWPGGSKLHNHPVIKAPPAMASIIPGPGKAADSPGMLVIHPHGGVPTISPFPSACVQTVFLNFFSLGYFFFLYLFSL